MAALQPYYFESNEIQIQTLTAVKVVKWIMVKKTHFADHVKGDKPVAGFSAPSNLKSQNTVSLPSTVSFWASFDTNFYTTAVTLEAET